MAILDSMQRRLDSGFSRSLRDYNDMALDCMDSDDPTEEDSANFMLASQKVANASAAAEQESLVKHNLTKSIIDGMQ